MKELMQRLSNIPDIYDDFIVGIVNYAKRSPEHIVVLNNYMNENDDLRTSDIVDFVMSQPDFHSFSAANKETQIV